MKTKKEEKRQTKRRHGFLKFLLFLILTAAAIFIFVSVSIWNYASVDEARQADVIIVLGASLSKDGVSPVFRERLNHGITLYNNGYADKIIITGGVGEGSYQSDAYVAGLYVMSMGVPEEDIILEEQSSITSENLEYSKEIMDEMGFSTAIIVSDPIHMKRAMSMAKDSGITAYSSPTPTSMYKSKHNRHLFLLRETVVYIGYELYRFIKLFVK